MFFIIPIGVDYRAARYPVVTFSIIGLNIVIFLASLFHGPLENPEIPFPTWYYNLFLTPADSPWYCWITSLFAHAGFMHIIGNMVYLFLFGSPVEDKMGRWQFAVFYLLGGLAANLTHIIFTPEHFASTMPLLGASGAISACMGAFALLMLRSKIEFKWIILFFIRIWSGEFFLPTWLVMSFWFLEDVLGAFLGLSHHGSGTAFGAHVGGFIAGMLMIQPIKLLWQRGIMRPANFEYEDEEEVVAPVRQVIPPRAAAPLRVQVKEAPVTYVTDNGSQTGPFTVTDIRRMVAAGEISQEAWYWREGMAEWKGVWEISG